MALILRPDGSSEQIAPSNRREFSLEELKRIVGEGAPVGEDWIEVRWTKDGRRMVLNESGKLLGLPRNDQATALLHLPTPKDIAMLRQVFGSRLVYLGPDLEEEADDYVPGTVLVCERHEVQ